MFTRPIFQIFLPPSFLEESKLHTKKDSEGYSHMFTRFFLKKFHLLQFKKEASYTPIMTVSAILICLHGLFSKFFASNSLRMRQVTHLEWLRVSSHIFTRPIFQKFPPPAVLEETKLHNKNGSECHSHMFIRLIFQKKSPLVVFEKSKLHTDSDFWVPFSYVYKAFFQEFLPPEV